ncbi:MAG: zf-HC2 domain-containing protein [Candidatus Rokubacteria bacterium]|nr:zf-HC2 domain-containing protein [Candidatus Rokubacteria bacterium]
MPTLGCLWYRSRLEAHADGALQGRAARAVSGHVGRCSACQATVERLSALRRLVSAEAIGVEEPEWSGFWPAVRRRIASEPPRPVAEVWWLPLWKPIWGHPRLATVTAALAASLLTFSLWPGREGELPAAWADPVVVQDVSTADPDGSVMVYHTPDRDVTVIWVFASQIEGQTGATTR